MSVVNQSEYNLIHDDDTDCVLIMYIEFIHPHHVSLL